MRWGIRKSVQRGFQYGNSFGRLSALYRDKADRIATKSGRTESEADQLVRLRDKSRKLLQIRRSIYRTASYYHISKGKKIVSNVLNRM